MNAVTIPPSKLYEASTEDSCTVVVSTSALHEERVIVLPYGLGTIKASEMNDTVAAVVNAPWKSKRALLMALSAVIYTQARVTCGEQEVSLTDDGGLVLEFVSRNGREVLYAVPEDGCAMFFVARDHGDRKAGVVLGPIGVDGLAAWLAGVGPLPIEHLKLG